MAKNTVWATKYMGSARGLLRRFGDSAYPSSSDAQGSETAAFEGEVLFLGDFNFPLSGASSKLSNATLTPKKVFEHLDKRVIGQTEAKRVLSIAYRKEVH